MLDINLKGKIFLGRNEEIGILRFHDNNNEMSIGESETSNEYLSSLEHKGLDDYEYTPIPEWLYNGSKHGYHTSYQTLSNNSFQFSLIIGGSLVYYTGLIISQNLLAIYDYYDHFNHSIYYLEGSSWKISEDEKYLVNSFKQDLIEQNYIMYSNQINISLNHWIKCFRFIDEIKLVGFHLAEGNCFNQLKKSKLIYEGFRDSELIKRIIITPENLLELKCKDQTRFKFYYDLEEMPELQLSDKEFYKHKEFLKELSLTSIKVIDPKNIPLTISGIVIDIKIKPFKRSESISVSVLYEECSY